MERANNVFIPISQKEILELLKSEAYLLVSRKMIKVMGLIPAVILSNYIDKHRYYEKFYPENNGWFWLPQFQQEQELGISENALSYIKKDLIDKGILKIQKRGMPARTLVKIDFQKVISHIYKQGETPASPVPEDIRGLVPEDIRGLIYNKNNIIGVPEGNAQNKKKDIKERTEVFLPLAKSLYKTIKSKKNITYNLHQVKMWANDIRILSEQNHIEYSRIEKVLLWYETNIGGEYIPVIESGYALKMKFTKLEDAMGRKSYSTSSKPKFKEWDGRKWYLQENGEYRNKAGELWVD